MIPLCGYSLVVKFQPSTLAMWVRFPLPALLAYSPKSVTAPSLALVVSFAYFASTPRV